MAVGDIVRIDGWPVARGTAEDFYRLKDAFDRQGFRDSDGNPVTLHIFSGYRSYDDQKKIFLERYVTASAIRGRHVFDTRWWDGQVWYRISGEGTVAQPGTSNHGNGRALDVNDSGCDAGVSRFNNERSNWLRANAWRYSFNPAGYGFQEPWHIEATRVDQWSGTPVAPADAGNATPFNPDQEEDDMFTEDDRKKQNAIYDALLKDGKDPKDWSTTHYIGHTWRQLNEPSLDGPKKGEKWSGLHILSWLARALASDVIDRLKRIEKKLGIEESK